MLIQLPPCCYSAVILFSHTSILRHRLSAPGMPVQRSRGPPGEQTHAGGYAAVPQSPLPPPSPFPLCLPPLVAPRPCLYVPASLPYDLDADKARGPAVPSAWCQHFPLIQSPSCCVTDGIGDQKQLPSPKKKVFDNRPTTKTHTVCSAFLTIRGFF